MVAFAILSGLVIRFGLSRCDVHGVDVDGRRQHFRCVAYHAMREHYCCDSDTAATRILLRRARHLSATAPQSCCNARYHAGHFHAMREHYCDSEELFLGAIFDNKNRRCD
eukprot:COSAG01_NODE_1931_length_8874_cov_108.307236_2_plen_110_part_00